ncbi:hypothetical protein [Streptomyces sp. NPDC048489]|uniref:hypothetical protein n=1 Tax=Streptomyces sp. NPDC048489 TaxID=3154504 RepID=UPI0034271ACB
MASTVGNFDLPSTSTNVTTTSDTDSASIATVAGTTVDVPKAASNGVKLKSSSEQIAITMPNTSGTQTGTVTAPGIVSYPTASGNVANAVQTDANGAVRFLTVLKDASAPEEFEYNLQLPEGSSITKEDNGSLKVTTPAGGYTIALPWAHDANGEHVWTQWFTDGESTIDLVVNHHGENLAYPITADPWISWGWAGFTWNFSRGETNNIAVYGSTALSPFMGTPAAAAAVAAGGQWYADYSRKHNLCMSIWKSYYSYYMYAYSRRC